jgi:hypothetical protein
MKYSTSSFSGAAAAAGAPDAAAFPFTAAADAADAPHDFDLFVPPRHDDFDYDALFAGDPHGAEAFMDYDDDYDDGAGEGEEYFQGGGVTKRFTKRRPRPRLRRKYSDNYTKKSKKMKKRRITKRSRKNK